MKYPITPEPNTSPDATNHGVSLRQIVERTKHNLYRTDGQFVKAIFDYFAEVMRHEPSDEQAAARYAFKRDLRSDNIAWGTFYTAMCIMGQQVTITVEDT